MSQHSTPRRETPTLELRDVHVTHKTRTGGLFKQGYNAELDELLDLVEHGENRVKALLDEEQKASGISKLKLGYNRVFGYYFELSKAQAEAAPAHVQSVREAFVDVVDPDDFDAIGRAIVQAAQMSTDIHHKAYHDTLMARLRLKGAVGTLDEVDLQEINALLRAGNS